jgi:hypothetical protein
MSSNARASKKKCPLWRVLVIKIQSATFSGPGLCEIYRSKNLAEFTIPQIYFMLLLAGYHVNIWWLMTLFLDCLYAFQITW